MGDFPDGYWDLRTEPVVVDGLMWPVTACAECGKRFPPYMAAVPSNETGDYCWGHCVNCKNLMRSIDQIQNARNEDAERHEHARIIAEQERLDTLRASRANRSRWKNARRDFVAVRAERDAAVAELVALRAWVVGQAEETQRG